MKKWAYQGILLYLFVISFTACHPAASSRFVFDAETDMIDSSIEEPEPIYIILTHSSSADSLTDKAAHQFKETLEKISNYQFYVDIYPYNALGDLTDSREYFSNGAIDIRIGTPPSASLSTALWLPILTDSSLEDIRLLLEPGTELWNAIDQECAEQNIKLLANFHIFPRVLTTNEKITCAEDIQKLKIRVIGTGPDELIWQALGADTIPYTLDSVYLALQQNVVNSQENALITIMGNDLYEQQKYIVETNHRLHIESVFVNQTFYDTLTVKQQELLETAVTIMLSKDSENIKSYLEESRQLLDQYQVEYISLPADELKKIRETMAPIVKENLNQHWGEETVNNVIRLATPGVTP